MPRRTKEQALATRERILDMAELEFQRRGVSRTSLDHIARAAGVSRGAIYWHFENKADLFIAMIKRVTLPLEQAILQSGDPRLADPVQHLRRSFVEALRKTVTDPQVRRVFEVATQKVEYVEALKAVQLRRIARRSERVSRMERGLRLARRRGDLRNDVPAKSAAIGLHALVDGLIVHWMQDCNAFDLVRVGTLAIDTYLAGLGKRD